MFRLASAWLLASVYVSCFCLPLCVRATQVGQHRHVVASSLSVAIWKRWRCGCQCSLCVSVLLDPWPAMLLAKCTLTCITSTQCVPHQASNAQCAVLQDVVTRGGKFFFLYKRPGHRVIVNDGGHMMVSPSSMEASVHASLAGVHVC